MSPFEVQGAASMHGHREVNGCITELREVTPVIIGLNWDDSLGNSLGLHSSTPPLQAASH